MKSLKKLLLPFLLAACILTGCGGSSASLNGDGAKAQAQSKSAEVSSEEISEVPGSFDFSEIPEYSGDSYVAVNDNTPYFTKKELSGAKKSYEEYSELDSLGRCGICMASVGQDIMPTEERGEIGSVKPTGWHTEKYDCVDGKYLYNRAHLLGFQLTGENANEKNLITGTRYLNVDGMLPFENMVADYVKETDNHVLYRVTPVFEGDNLLASGVLMEAESVEDKGESILFNVYCYNVQPGVTIDYATGDSKEESSATKKKSSGTKAKSTEKTTAKSTTAKSAAAKSTTAKSTTAKKKTTKKSKKQTVKVWITDSGTKYHSKSGCSNMEDPRQVTLEEAESMGYEACKRCH